MTSPSRRLRHFNFFVLQHDHGPIPKPTWSICRCPIGVSWLDVPPQYYTRHRKWDKREDRAQHFGTYALAYRTLDEVIAR